MLNLNKNCEDITLLHFVQFTILLFLLRENNRVYYDRRALAQAGSKIVIFVSYGVILSCCANCY